MNIENILKYQKVDEELFKVEQKLYNSSYRKKANELSAIAKKAQTRSTELEAEAERLIAEIDDIKAKYNINKSKTEELLSTNVENLSMEDLEKLSTLKGKVAQNLNILEKMLQKSAENINRILSDFNKAKKAFDEARTQYAVCKQKIDEETKTLEPEKEKLKKDLQVLEKDVDPQLMTEYKRNAMTISFQLLFRLKETTFVDVVVWSFLRWQFQELKIMELLFANTAKDLFIKNKKAPQGVFLIKKQKLTIDKHKNVC